MKRKVKMNNNLEAVKKRVSRMKKSGERTQEDAKNRNDMEEFWYNEGLITACVNVEYLIFRFLENGYKEKQPLNIQDLISNLRKQNDSELSKEKYKN